MAAGPFLAALVTGFLLAAPYLANLFVEHSRQLYMWRLRDTLLLTGMLVGFAAIAVAVRRILARFARAWVVRIYDHLFVLALGAGLLANLWFQTKRPVGYRLAQDGMEIRTLWIALGAAIGWSLSRPGGSLVGRCRQLCTLLTPAMVLVCFNLFMAATYPPRMDPLPAAGPASPAAGVSGRPADSPVYLFILDEWSYPRTYREGKVRADMPHLGRLSGAAVTFHDAHACADSTETSIPRLLFETDLPVVYEPGRVGFQRDGRTVATTEFNSIFRHYRDRGYRTVMIGFALPFAQILGDQVDCCRTYGWYHVRPGLASQAGTHLVRSMQYWTDPWSQFVHDRVWPRMKYDQIVARQEDMKRDLLSLIARQPTRTLTVFHYALPHNPYMYDERGAYVGPANTSYQLSDVAGYERNLAALDRFIGEVVEALRGAGRYDNSMLVLTSDHGFRYEPEQLAGKSPEPLTHVPLIVKLPHQHEPLDVSESYTLQTAGRLIDNGLSAQGDARTFAARLFTSSDELFAERTP